VKLSFVSAAAVAASLVLASTVGASAADMPTKAPVYAPIAMYNWSGFYAGVNAGAAFGRSSTQTSTVFSPTGYFAATSVTSIAAVGDQSANKAGFTGGLQLGYNWQINSAVIGLEADFGYMGTRTSVTSGAVYPCCAPTAYSITQSAKTDWLMTLRPRVGIANNNWLLYVTGGLAIAQVKGDFNFTDTFATAAESASISKTKVGWALGGGVEYALAGKWSLKAEYLHVDLGSVSGTSTNLTAFGPPAIGFPTSVFTHSVKVTDDIVRVGLNYKL
jgi:outer membrane immunogenic protein